MPTNFLSSLVLEISAMTVPHPSPSWPLLNRSVQNFSPKLGFSFQSISSFLDWELNTERSWSSEWKRRFHWICHLSRSPCPYPPSNSHKVAPTSCCFRTTSPWVTLSQGDCLWQKSSGESASSYAEPDTYIIIWNESNPERALQQ